MYIYTSVKRGICIDIFIVDTYFIILFSHQDRNGVIFLNEGVGKKLDDFYMILKLP